MRGHASEAISRPGCRSSGVTQSRSNGVRAHSAWLTTKHKHYTAVILLTLVICAGIVAWGLHEQIPSAPEREWRGLPEASFGWEATLPCFATHNLSIA